MNSGLKNILCLRRSPSACSFCTRGAAVIGRMRRSAIVEIKFPCNNTKNDKKKQPKPEHPEHNTTTKNTKRKVRKSCENSGWDVITMPCDEFSLTKDLRMDELLRKLACTEMSQVVCSSDEDGSKAHVPTHHWWCPRASVAIGMLSTVRIAIVVVIVECRLVESSKFVAW